MKLLSLISICHLASVISLVTPILSAPRQASSLSSLKARAAPPAAYKSLSEEDYTSIVEPILGLGNVVTPTQVQRINKIRGVYARFCRSTRALHGASKHPSNPFRRTPDPDTTPRAAANSGFVQCLKFQSTFTGNLQPSTIQLCEHEHPSVQLRKAMEDAFFPHQLPKMFQGRSRPGSAITRD
ncbi:MAG: hypothetical protein M1826_003416 [Phylliscum demangeonii]|nr:MAG: hypothetical protein M1826_003416 [Phylliscum demangeonii]